jgi:hypothetical protein
LQALADERFTLSLDKSNFIAIAIDNRGKSANNQMKALTFFGAQRYR